MYIYLDYPEMYRLSLAWAFLAGAASGTVGLIRYIFIFIFSHIYIHIHIYLHRANPEYETNTEGGGCACLTRVACESGVLIKGKLFKGALCA